MPISAYSKTKYDKVINVPVNKARANAAIAYATNITGKPPREPIMMK
jgi:hypothetical protein